MLPEGEFRGGQIEGHLASHLEYGSLLSRERCSDNRTFVHTDIEAIAYRGPGIDHRVEPASVAQVSSSTSKSQKDRTSRTKSEGFWLSVCI